MSVFDLELSTHCAIVEWRIIQRNIMEITMLSPQELLPYERNPRDNAEAVEQVANSIREFGFRQPIVVDEDNIILAGHTRHLASLELGLDQVPVHIASQLTDAQKRAFRIMDNRSSDLAEWDRNLLKLELQDISDFDYDMTLTGFSLEDIAKMTGGATLEFALDASQLDEGSGPVEEFFDEDYTPANVKMFHIYLDSETEPKFRQMVARIQEKLGLENATDTIYRVIEDAHSNLQS